MTWLMCFRGASTLKGRRTNLNRICQEYGDKPMLMNKANVLNLRDSMADRPGAADNTVKTLKAMYSWALEPEIVSKKTG